MELKPFCNMRRLTKSHLSTTATMRTPSKSIALNKSRYLLQTDLALNYDNLNVSSIDCTSPCSFI